MEEEEDAGLRVCAMVAGKPKLVLVPAGEAEAAEAADTAGPGAPPDFWAKRVPGRTFGGGRGLRLQCGRQHFKIRSLGAHEPE